MCSVETDALNAQLPSSSSSSSAAAANKEEPKLVEYERSPPQIKVTLGLRHSASEMCAAMGDQHTHFSTADSGPVDGHYAAVWTRMGADPSDVTL